MALVNEILISNQTKLRLIRGDITERNVDAIVNAANSYLRHGGGVAAAMKPPKWLKAGDVVKIAIDKIGEIENRVIAEPENTPRI